MSKLSLDNERLTERLQRMQEEHAKDIEAFVLSAGCTVNSREPSLLLCRARAKVVSATPELVALRQRVKEKAAECETLQTEVFNCRNSLDELRAEVCLHF